ncbi:MAG: DUF1565 domain-containing protein, partial [Phycisphaerales bacterium]
MIRSSHTSLVLTALVLLSYSGPVGADAPAEGPGESLATAFHSVPADLDAAAPGAEFHPPPAAPRQPGGHAGPVPVPRIDRADVERVRAGIRGPTIIVDWHGTWDYTTIQEALDAAVDGDKIIVLPSAGSPAGAYVENLLFPARAIVLRSINPDDPAIVASTVIDGAWLDSVITFAPGTPPEAELSGFTITNGDADRGGGLYLYDSSPSISNNAITTNSAANYGGGLYLIYSHPLIANNMITGNSASYGGGLYLWSSSPTLANNTVAGNSCSERGGAVYQYNSSATIANNTITGNSADDGGGLYLYSSSPTIANNAITGNTASSRGGGLHLVSSGRSMITGNAITDNIAIDGGGLYLYFTSPTIASNIIMGNSADDGGGGLNLYYSAPTIANNRIAGNDADVGGALYLDISHSTIANNIIMGNGAGRSGGAYLRESSPTIVNNTITGNGGGLYLRDGSPTIVNTIIAFNSSGFHRLNSTDTPTLRFNCVYGNEEYNYSGISDPTGTDGNISADPLLADRAYGNMHIQPDSPCADAGSNADVAGDKDIDGQPRLQPGGGTVDIGADESDGTAWAPGPRVIVRVAPDGDDAHDGSSWALAKQTVQAGIDAAASLGGEVWVAGGTYLERIILHPYAFVYGGFSGNEAERHERDWGANVTVLDGQQQGSVVTALAGHRVSAVEGFTITNGGAIQGGGLHVRSCSPTIASNTISGNSASYGGGLYLYHSYAMIFHNTITSNSASHYGGGLSLRSSSPKIANNTITGNSARWDGGGLFLNYGSPTITNNKITDNSADGGGGLHLNNASPTIANNTVAGNTASYYGGGMYLNDSYSSLSTLTNNTITGNSA